MKINNISKYALMALALGLWSCGDEIASPEPEADINEMRFEVSHPWERESRATETAFETGDVVGLFMTHAGGVLEISGNAVNNEPLTYTGAQWTTPEKLYWNNGTYDAYAYYPRQTGIESVSDMEFALSLDQRDVPGGKSGFEKSDFLFASAKGLKASAEPVKLQFGHIMSKLSIRLVKGDEFEGEIPEDAIVYVHNTVPKATIDLSAGVATKDMHASRATITAKQNAPRSYSAIIVPQRLENRVPFIEVVMKGVSYLYETRFVFKPGIHHIVNLIIDKNPDRIKIEIGGEIVNWN